MIILVLGANGSGKSLYAEKLVDQISTYPRYYIATMIPYGEEGRSRVKRHRKQRRSLGFITIEKPYRVSQLSLQKEATVLLEDVSNLLGNTLFNDECKGSIETVYEDISALGAKCRHLILVTIDGLTVQAGFDDETTGYVSALNALNKKLLNISDTVVSMQNGAPSLVRGNLNALD